jgi:hypothetical protein
MLSNPSERECSMMYSANCGAKKNLMKFQFRKPALSTILRVDQIKIV